MLPDKVLISGIGTDVGKTLVSAILCQKFKYDYWKPVQCGDLENSDSGKVKTLSPDTRIFPEAYSLKEPLSPHHAAELESLSISGVDIPESQHLLIEGAGGLMVPINNDLFTFADFAKEYDLPVILVSQNYLGSINHTLLSLELLNQKNINLIGV